ncbi:DUF1848 domain-containing protein [bacterium]|nr:MAG: DUF1848 domain-containing protein [bacterium]
MTKRQIISVSRRTDIPAFYAEWFMSRIRAGYCSVVNPFNANQVSYVGLKPNDVIGFVFWTRNPQPLLKYLPELDKNRYKYYFQYTLIGYPREIDPKCPPVDSAVKTFKELSRLIGKEKVIWRYDPILLSNKTSYQWHTKQVDSLMKTLSGYTERLVISFIDPYRKTKIRMDKETSDSFELFPNVYDVQTYNKIAEHMGSEAKKYGLEVQSCAEGVDLNKYGISHGKCIDDELFSRIIRAPLLLKKDPSQRETCGCVMSKDIGVNNTCLFGCKYCYATSSIKSAQDNHRKHDMKSPSLIGWFDVPEPKKQSQAQPELF